MPEALKGAQVVLLGEIHDNPAHHVVQADIVAALQPQAIVFEMIGASEARRITAENRTNPDVLAETLNWAESGWPDFELYYPIIASAPEAAIFGGALPRAEVRAAVTESASAVFGGAAALFGLDQPLPEGEQEERIALQREAHCNAMPEEFLPGMVEAQRLRDAAMARATVAALAHATALSDDPKVVVIAGNGHTREDWGIPAYLRAYFAGRDDAPVIASLGQFEDAPPEGAPFSMTEIAPAPERDDPCLAFAE